MAGQWLQLANQTKFEDFQVWPLIMLCSHTQAMLRRYALFHRGRFREDWPRLMSGQILDWSS